MNDHALPVNRHPVDQLGDIRATIKVMEEREAELKAEVSELMGTDDVLGGDEYIARQAVSERAGAIDTKAMERDGIDIEKYRKPKVAVFSIRTEKRVQGEA
ncbi:hypothetical protein [Brucella sp. IR073]|uniref:hypothetical protein n=1 Tax=unclassified Brucella TaxID=2632610 RepID=UPI003B97D684